MENARILHRRVQRRTRGSRTVQSSNEFDERKRKVAQAQRTVLVLEDEVNDIMVPKLQLMRAKRKT